MVSARTSLWVFGHMLRCLRPWGMRLWSLTTGAGVVQVCAVDRCSRCIILILLAIAGTPRHIIYVSEQLDDYRAVIKHCRQQSEIDPQKVILWGTSFSGKPSTPG